jgi:predicted  nucleic acid-binding Zn-ribbon protein
MSAVLKEEDFVEARIARLESDVAHIRSDVSEMKTDIRELKQGVGDLNKKVAEISGEIKNVDARLDAKIDKVAAVLQAEIAKSLSSVRVWWIGTVLALVGMIAHGFKWI